MLDIEIDFYNSQLNDLRSTSMDKFVLIKGESIIGIYESEVDAYTEGLIKIGNVPFLIKRISASDASDVTIPAYALGLIDADF